MYVKKTWYTGQVIEVEKVCSFRYKGKSTVRGPKLQRTPELMRRMNERNARKKLRRLLNLNFGKTSTHTVLTYNLANRTTDAEKARQDLAKFWREIKKRCRRAGTVLKYVAVAEHGKRSIHFHCVIDCGLPLEVIQECWPHGVIHSTPLYSGDYAQLAEYLLKESSRTFNDPQLAVHRKRWTASRNLEQPVPVVEIVKADSWREQPKAPRGFYVLTDSVKSGVSEFTGWPYQYYRCRAITGKGGEMVGKQKHRRSLRSGSAGKNKNYRPYTAKR